MKILKQPSNGFCMLYSAAMLLDVDPDILIAEIGAQGDEVWWPDAPEGMKERSYHIQEIIDCFLRRGYALTPIEVYPRMAPNRELEPRLLKSRHLSEVRFVARLQGSKGLLIGQNIRGGNHACAWDGTRIYDPATGSIEAFESSGFSIREYWLQSIIKSEI